MRYVLLLLFVQVSIYSLTPEQLLEIVDKNHRNYETLNFKATMDIKSKLQELSKTFNGTVMTKNSTENSFMEYTNPQDRGTRYLKLNQDLWIYIPDAQDVLKISGHLLRDSMMGSDISYDDILDQSAYATKYTPTEIINTNLSDDAMYMLTLIAKNNSVSYAQIDMFVDKKNNFIRKIIMYAKGRDTNRPIKEFEMNEYKQFDELFIATKLTVRDLRKKNSMTMITYHDLQINPTIDPKIFTRVNLEK
ncbi:MAG: outer membrane lipoprotein-sorting protein [Brevinema sp.]